MRRLDRCKVTQANNVVELGAPARKTWPRKEDLWGKVYLSWAAKMGNADVFLAAVLGYMAHRKGLAKFELPDTLFQRYGFHRNTRRRALARFESRGLIKIVKRGRRAPLVTIVGGEAAED